MNPYRHLFSACNHLSENGCIIISLPNIRHISALYSIFFKGTFSRCDRGIFDRTHLHWFTIKDAKQHISDAGLVVDAISYSLRIGDKGGGFLNRLMNKISHPLCSFLIIREFFTYQFCIRAVREQ